MSFVVNWSIWNELFFFSSFICKSSLFVMQYRKHIYFKDNHLDWGRHCLPICDRNRKRAKMRDSVTSSQLSPSTTFLHHVIYLQYTINNAVHFDSFYLCRSLRPLMLLMKMKMQCNQKQLSVWFAFFTRRHLCSISFIAHGDDGGGDVDGGYVPHIEQNTFYNWSTVIKSVKHPDEDKSVQL